MSWSQKSYDEVPALSVRGRQLRRSLRAVTVAWMFGIVWMTCVVGSRTTIFARMLGFNNFHFGLLSAVPFIATLGQLVATVLIERTGLTKHQFLQFGAASRLLWLVVAAIPLAAMLGFLPALPAQWAVWTMLAVILVSGFLFAMAAPAWLTWMGDLIPRRIRGRYMAARTRIAASVQIPVVIGLAVVLDRITRYDPATGQKLPVTADEQSPLLWAICAVFAAAAVIGTIDILLFRRLREVLRSTRDALREPAVRIEIRRPTKGSVTGRLAFLARYARAAADQLLVDPLRDTVFRRYVIYGATITFAMSVGGPYYWRNMLENLGFSQVSTDVLFMVLSPVVAIFAAKGWGRLTDRWGRRPVLILATFCIIFSVSPHFFATRQTPAPQFVADGVNAVAGLVKSWTGWGDAQWITPDTPVGAWLVLFAAMIFGGVGWTGVVLAQHGIILGFSDGHGRSKYVAAHAVLIGLGGVVGGITGGTVSHLLRGLQAAPILAGPFVWNNWHAAFALSLLARIVALGWALRMPDPGSTRMRVVVRYWGSNVYNYAATRLFYRLRIFGWGRRGPKP